MDSPGTRRQGRSGAAQVPSSRGGPRGGLAVVCLETFVLIAFVLMVPPALPQIDAALRPDFVTLQWFPNAFALSQASLLLVAGSLGDRFGHRRSFILGAAGFSLSALACASAPTALLLDCASAMAGLSAACAFGSMLALLAHGFEPAARRGAFGTWGISIALSYALSPILGSLLVQSLGWRSIFAALAATSALAALLGAKVLAETPRQTGLSIDWPSAILCVAALGPFIYVLLSANTVGWSSRPIVVGTTISLISLLVFITRQFSVAHPLLDLSLFRQHAFSAAALAVAVLSACLYAFIFYVLVYLQQVGGNTAITAALLLLPVTGFGVIISLAMPKLMRRVEPMELVAVSLLLLGLGLLAVHPLEEELDYSTFLAGFLLVGAAHGSINAPIALIASNAVSHERSGMATSMNNSFRLIGVALGFAVSGFVFQHQVSDQLELGAGSGSARTVASVAAGNFDRAAGHSSEASFTPSQAQQAFVGGANDVLLVLGLATLAAAVVVVLLSLSRRRLDRS